MRTFVKTALFLFFIGFFHFCSLTIYGQIDKGVNEKIEVTGIIYKYLPKTTQTTAFYILKDDAGDTVKIITDVTSGLPEINKRYNIKGILIEQNGEFIIIEKMSKCLDCPQPFFSFKSNYGLYLIILGCCILIIIIIIILSTKKAQKKYQPEIIKHHSPYPRQVGVTSSYSGGFTTIKLQTNVPKTLRFIPGYFQIISGEDKGKTFRVPGYPTPEGNSVFIGSEEATGDSAPCHIQLKDKSVAPKQAEIVNKEGILFIKNLNEVNLTRVNNVELKLNETTKLKPGSVIKMGEIEFLYKI